MKTLTTVTANLKLITVSMVALGMLTLPGCLGVEATEVIDANATSDKTTAAGSGSNGTQVADDDSSDAPALEKVKVEVAEPTDTDKVTLGAAASPIKDGVATVAVRIRMFEPWHIYAVDKPTGVSTPSKLELKLPEGVTAVGEWEYPEPKDYGDNVFIYAKDVTFRCQVKVASGSGPVDVGCKVSYQACSESSCLAPTSSAVKATVQ